MKHSKKQHKSTFRKINDWLHLWLGISSGIIVFIVSITGCIYVFQKEIKDTIESWRFVQVQEKPFIAPSHLIAEAQKHFPNKKATGLTYARANEAAAVGFEKIENGKKQFSVVFMNPYDASFIKKKTLGEEFDIFRFIINGHRALWLPYKIGRPIVGAATLVFCFLLISGLIMWWPKRWKKKYVKPAMTLKWKARFKRLNYDLHNVLGFYVFLLALIVAVTGVSFSYKWVRNGIYYLSSGGATRPEHSHPHSFVPPKVDSNFNYLNNLDKAWITVMNSSKTLPGGMYIAPYPEDAEDPIEITVYKDYQSFYDREEHFFDQYSLKPIRQKGDRYQESSIADQLVMLNYDIHVGAVWGLTSKIIAFIVSLICASLPITGFLVWWHKK